MDLYELWEYLLGTELLDQCLDDPCDFVEFEDAWNKGYIQPLLSD